MIRFHFFPLYTRDALRTTVAFGNNSVSWVSPFFTLATLGMFQVSHCYYLVQGIQENESGLKIPDGNKAKHQRKFSVSGHDTETVLNTLLMALAAFCR